MGEIVDWLTSYNHRRLDSSLGYVRQFEKACRPAKPSSVMASAIYAIRETRAKSGATVLEVNPDPQPGYLVGAGMVDLEKISWS